MPNKILVIFLSGLGNAILFRPFLAALKRFKSEMHIDMLIENKIVEDILTPDGLVDKYWYWSDSVFSRLFLLSRLRDNKYDAIVTTFEAQGWKLALFARLIGQSERIGYRKSRWYDALYTTVLPIDKSAHEVQRHLLLLSAFGIDCSLAEADISLQLDENTYAYLPKYFIEGRLRVCMHAGSSDNLSKKRWPLNKFIELGGQIYQKYGAQIIFVGGKNERHMKEQITVNAKYPTCILIGQLNLWETAYVLKNSDLLIANDAGLMHLASALGTSTAAIFGPTDQIKNRPWGKENLVISKNIPCSPCDITKKCAKNMTCLNEITVEEVLEQIDGVIEGLIETKVNK